ncbi:hypothetical protein AC02_1682 [Escherichia coli 3-020-07_S3_C1]|nr:hypothetical protein AD32_1807 [Escherichia coli 2-460-02_S4_C3]KDZ39463.1 hypothetical protein AC02_1682 [Escherichia coli 3-020-07_S3_C1]KEJ50326.1 hypothetical protein AC74_2291 [Escherichia coli 2-460-02_S4_C1]KEJ68025.1 hypothetical protein AC30_2430 [Escherichia coli 3-020-07_S3_C2]
MVSAHMNSSIFIKNFSGYAVDSAIYSHNKIRIDLLVYNYV